jgi:hypothetical protein
LLWFYPGKIQDFTCPGALCKWNHMVYPLCLVSFATFFRAVGWACSLLLSLLRSITSCEYSVCPFTIDGHLGCSDFRLLWTFSDKSPYHFISSRFRFFKRKSCEIIAVEFDFHVRCLGTGSAVWRQ